MTRFGSQRHQKIIIKKIFMYLRLLSENLTDGRSLVNIKNSAVSEVMEQWLTLR